MTNRSGQRKGLFKRGPRPHKNAGAPKARHKDSAERAYWDQQLKISRNLNKITVVAQVISIIGLIFLWLSFQSGNGSTVAANRAWLSPNNPQLQRPRLGEPMRFQLGFVNTGKEPALDVKYIIKGGIATLPKNMDMENLVTSPNTTCESLKSSPGKDVIYPNGGNYIVIITSDTPDNKFSVDQSLLNSRNLYYFNGCIVYRTFGKRRSSSFCYVLTPSKSANGDDFFFSSCPKGNFAE